MCAAAVLDQTKNRSKYPAAAWLDSIVRNFISNNGRKPGILYLCCFGQRFITVVG